MDRTYRLHAFGRPLDLEPAEPPEPRGKAVLIRIEAAGICHSDLNICSGHVDLGHGRRLDVSGRVPLPATPGHEIAGQIIAVGPDAPVERLGERVAVYPWIGCGSCRACAAGDDPRCTAPQHLGFERPGGFATHVLVPDARYCLPIGPMPAARAALLGCAGLTAWSAVEKCADRLGRGAGLTVIGAGGVGLAAIGIARRRFADAPVRVIDRNPGLSPLIEELTGHPLVEAGSPDDVAKALNDSDCAIDCVGSGATLRLALDHLPKGGRVVAVGLFGGALDIPTFQIVTRGLSLCGSFVGSLSEFSDLVAFAAAHPDWTIPHRLQPFESLNACLESLDRGAVTGRLVLTP